MLKKNKGNHALKIEEEVQLVDNVRGSMDLLLSETGENYERTIIYVTTLNEKCQTKLCTVVVYLYKTLENGN